MSSSDPIRTAPKGMLRRGCLTLRENLAQTLGSMAPSGGLAVIIPLVFANAGNGTWLLYVPTLAAYFFLAVVLNAFGSRSASAGGLAAYAEAGLGRWAGIGAGWSYLLALVFAMASAAPSAAFYGGLVLHRAAGLTPGPALGALLTALFAGGAWFAAHRDIRLSTNVMLGIECLSIGAMVLLAARFLGHTHRWIDSPQLQLSGVSGGGLRLGLMLALMSLTGFETVTTLGEESKQALRTIPRSIVACLTPVGILYLLMAYVLASAFRGSQVALNQADAPFDHLAAQAGWPGFSVAVSAGVTLSFFACLLGCLNAAARVAYAMARKGQAWPSLGEVHRRNATPARAVGCLSLLAVCLPLGLLGAGVSLGDCVAYLSQLASIGFVVSYFWVCLAAPIYLRKVRGLTVGNAAASGLAGAIFGYALLASVYPLPPWPWRALPYVFFLCVAGGVLRSVACWMLADTRNPRVP